MLNLCVDFNSLSLLDISFYNLIINNVNNFVILSGVTVISSIIILYSGKKILDTAIKAGVAVASTAIGTSIAKTVSDNIKSGAVSGSGSSSSTTDSKTDSSSSNVPSTSK
jgi:hypothetical protein